MCYALRKEHHCGVTRHYIGTQVSNVPRVGPAAVWCLPRLGPGPTATGKVGVANLRQS